MLPMPIYKEDWLPLTSLQGAPNVYCNTLWCSFCYPDFGVRLVAHDDVDIVETEFMLDSSFANNKIFALDVQYKTNINLLSIETYDIISCLSYEAFDYILSNDYIAFYETMKKFHALVSVYDCVKLDYDFNKYDYFAFSPVDYLLLVFFKEENHCIQRVYQHRIINNYGRL